MKSINLESFLRSRMYLIDLDEKDNECVVLTIEYLFKEYKVNIYKNFVSCSCNSSFVCKHIKFILQNISGSLRYKKSESYNNLSEYHNRLFYVNLNKDIIKPNLFMNNKNPRFMEYKIIEHIETKHSPDSESICYVCLEKLSKKIIRCKSCNKYYHDRCIYGWLRISPLCTCPNCRMQWI